MSNADRIIRQLDSHLDHPVSLVLYGRAAIALGYENPPAPVKLSLDVDGIIPNSEIEKFRADSGFWDAQEATNRDLEKEGLYITHLFTAADVFLRADWESQIVPIELSGLRWLHLFRPATTDLVLTKMMRGDDPQDMADIQFLIQRDQITPEQMEAAFASVQISDLVELRDAFNLAKPTVLKIARAFRK